MSEKLCIECDCFFIEGDGREVCRHGDATAIFKDVVVGKRKSYDSCIYQRTGGICGPAGVNWRRKKGAHGPLEIR